MNSMDYLYFNTAEKDSVVLMRERMASQVQDFSVVDVYDLASSIGKEFEKIIDICGPEHVTELMPKVIVALEHLEILANENQKENNEIADLKFAIDRLEAEKAAKAEEREKYEKELEQIEEGWQDETKDLINTITRLQEDNRKLRKTIGEHEVQSEKFQTDKPSNDLKLVQEITELQETLMKERNATRLLKREYAQKNIDLEAMTQQFERVVKQNSDYRRKNTLTTRQATNLIQEKADLQAELHDKEQQIHQIKETLGPNGAPKSPDLMTMSLEGKMVIDMNDPDRPRFTMNELRDVLNERNELKAKLIEVEDDLQHYKPVEQQRQEEEEEDRPVQGPMPREPDEKLHPGLSKDSGIKKFFSFILSPSKSSNRKPQRPSIRK